MKLVISITLLFFLLIGQATAGCLYQGKDYPAGTKINGLECQKDGKWKKSS